MPRAHGRLWQLYVRNAISRETGPAVPIITIELPLAAAGLLGWPPRGLDPKIEESGNSRRP
jgi:hypothetical protein